MSVFKDDPNLQALWLFENNLYDYTGNDNDLTDNGVGYSADCKEGLASLNLEKDDSEYGSITDGDQTGLDFTGTFSICAWINLETDWGTRPIVEKWTADYSWRLEIENTDDIQMWVRNGADTAYGICIGATSLDGNTWYHVAAVYDGTDIRVYLDGSLDTNGASNPLTYSDGVHDTTDDVYVGRRSTVYYDGLIDELAVFNRALSATEIADIYAEGILDVRRPTAAYNNLAIY